LEVQQHLGETIKLLENRAEDKKLKEKLDNYNEKAKANKEIDNNRIQLCDEKWRSKIVVEKQKFDTVSHELGYNLQLQHPYHIFIFISTKKRFLTPTIHHLTQNTINITIRKQTRKNRQSV